jgi:hypothetical protein
MRRLRGIKPLLVGLWLLIGLVSNVSAEPKTELTPPNLTGTIKTVKVHEVNITVAGKLIRVMAIGGETTGWAVELDEPRQIGGERLIRLEVDPAGTKLGDFENRRIEIVGILEKRSGIERKKYWVVVVKEIRGLAN